MKHRRIIPALLFTAAAIILPIERGVSWDLVAGMALMVIVREARAAWALYLKTTKP